MIEFRCSSASADDGESMAGTAPTAEALLLVESPGPWGHQALADNRLPQRVRDHLAALTDVTVHLVRRPRGDFGTGTHVFLARRDGVGFSVGSALLPGPDALLDLDLDAGLEPHHEPMWLVCTNGKRDRCCAEVGRPIADALADRWPDGTWEVTHLGGHRFSGTLLSLPSGLTLGRLDPATALEACTAIEGGVVPVELCRGRAGRSGAEQVLELHVLAGGSPDVEVVAHPGPSRRQSCGDLKQKATVLYEVRGR